MDKDYFLQIEELKKPHNFPVTKEVAPKKLTMRRKVLDLLLERYPGRVTNLELNNICLRYGQRIKELREKGWEIENVRDRSQNGNVWVAWLENPAKGDQSYIPKYDHDPKVEAARSIPPVEIFQQHQQAMKL